MKQITRRISELEKRAGTGNPITLHIHKTIVGLNGEPERTEIKVIQLGEGVQA